MKEQTIPHVFEEGSRKHVLSYRLTPSGVQTICSEPNCEMNLSWGDKVKRIAESKSKVKL